MATDPNPKFTEAMFQVYRRAKVEAGYTATIFYRMVNENFGLPTAKALINAPKASDGYTALYELKRLDLTVEALVVENAQWRKLFTDEELKKAEQRLTNHEYVFKRP
ncbi:hypothetical protein ACLBWS_05385 [Brucellaceae bacterium D45D]